MLFAPTQTRQKRKTYFFDMLRNKVQGIARSRVLAWTRSFKTKSLSSIHTLRTLKKESKMEKPVIPRRVTKLRGAVLDFSGTIFDQFNKVTIESFQKMFAQLGIIVHMHDILPGIGKSKSDHIWQIMQIPHIAKQVRDLLGETPRPALAEILGKVSYVQTLSKQIHLAKVIDGSSCAIESLQMDHGMQVGITTGFPRSVADQVIRLCSKEIDMKSIKVVASDDAGIIAGRPLPYMLYQSMNMTGTLCMPMNADIVKIGDTPEDIAEGYNARAWTVAIAQDSALNPYLLDQSIPWSHLTPLERHIKTWYAAGKLAVHNPDYVVSSIASVPRVVQNINYRLEHGELPNALKDKENQKTNLTWI